MKFTQNTRQYLIKKDCDWTEWEILFIERNFDVIENDFDVMDEYLIFYIEDKSVVNNYWKLKDALYYILITNNLKECDITIYKNIHKENEDSIEVSFGVRQKYHPIRYNYKNCFKSQ